MQKKKVVRGDAWFDDSLQVEFYSPTTKETGERGVRTGNPHRTQRSSC